MAGSSRRPTSKSTGSSETLVSCRAEPGQGWVLKPGRMAPYQEACLQVAALEHISRQSGVLLAEAVEDVRFGQISTRKKRSSHN